MQPALEQVGPPFVADGKTATAEQPGKGALDHPAIPT
jgi:hypothetical protein